MTKLIGPHVFLGGLFALVIGLASATASAAGFSNKALAKNNGGANKDPDLANPWGLARGATTPFWVSDAASGLSTLYNAKGKKQSVVATVPPAMAGGTGSPTGIVSNGSTEFKINGFTSTFLFATLDGTISGWSNHVPDSAVMAVNNSASGAVYTGLAISNHASGNHLYAANAANGTVDIFDGNFNLVGTMIDGLLPFGFVPFGVEDIGGEVFVSFANDSGGSGGFVDVFSEDGFLLETLVAGGKLNQPWGMALAPANFGALSNTLLVANNTAKGTINGFDPVTGAYVGTVTNANGIAIKISGLWGIEFGGGARSNGKTNQLFYTAGPNDVDGIFGVIAPM